MPVDLHQRLSEYSYGYGVTREVELLLDSVGLRATPFLPNLIDEGSLGFDVGFERLGVPILLQFKLGQALQRFVRSDPTVPPPVLDKPFWRFQIDTAEVSGQYDLLRKAEHSGAEVYYVAPRFSDWSEYAQAFEHGNVLGQSLLISPSEIDNKLMMNGIPDGPHRIVYDTSRVYVCSKPIQAKEAELSIDAQSLRSKIIKNKRTMESALKELLRSFNSHRDIRTYAHEDEKQEMHHDEYVAWRSFSEKRELPLNPQQIALARKIRLANFREKSKSEADAVFATLGVESWSFGSQLVAVTLGDG